MRTRLFDEDMQYTKEGLKLDYRVRNLIVGLIDECDDKEICLRDLTYIINASIQDTILEKLIVWDKSLDKTEDS